MLCGNEPMESWRSHVDTWAKKGILEKSILPGHTRASGFVDTHGL